MYCSHHQHCGRLRGGEGGAKQSGIAYAGKAAFTDQRISLNAALGQPMKSSRLKLRSTGQQGMSYE